MASAIFICHIDLTASHSPMHTVLMKSHRWLRMQCCVVPQPPPPTAPFSSLSICSHPLSICHLLFVYFLPFAALSSPVISFCHFFSSRSHLLPFLRRACYAHGPNSIIDQIKRDASQLPQQTKGTHARTRHAEGLQPHTHTHTQENIFRTCSLCTVRKEAAQMVQIKWTNCNFRLCKFDTADRAFQLLLHVYHSILPRPRCCLVTKLCISSQLLDWSKSGRNWAKKWWGQSLLLAFNNLASATKHQILRNSWSVSQPIIEHCSHSLKVTGCEPTWRHPVHLFSLMESRDWKAWSHNINIFCIVNLCCSQHRRKWGRARQGKKEGSAVKFPASLKTAAGWMQRCYTIMLLQLVKLQHQFMSFSCFYLKVFTK